MTSKLSYYYEMSRQVHPLQAAPKLWNYVKYRCLEKQANTAIHRYTPQIAHIILTKRCNLDCSFCLAGSFLRKKGNDWRDSEATLDKVKRIFANPLFAHCLLVDLQGGEPLMVDDFEAIVAYLVKRGNVVNVSTNGILLAERVAGIKRAGIARINVSLYERNRAVMDRDLAKINRIFPTHASIVLVRSQVERRQDEILATARFAHEAGCRSLRLWLYRPVGVDPKPEETIADNLPAYIELRRRMEETLPGFCLWPTAIRKQGFVKLCPQLWQRINTDMLGNITICCGTDMTLQGPNSNLFDCEPEALYNHPTLVGMREQLVRPGCDPPDLCKNCSLLAEPGW
jgi:MoaA/NifB/PqqE/SkfB family radical SAM enzyme